MVFVGRFGRVFVGFFGLIMRLYFVGRLVGGWFFFMGFFVFKEVRLGFFMW